MSFTTSFFAVSSPAGEQRERVETMEVDENEVNDAGARATGDTTDEEPMQDPEPSLPQPPNADTSATNNGTGTSHLITSQTSPSPQKDDDTSFIPEHTTTTSQPPPTTLDSPTTTTTMMAPKKPPVKKKGTASTIKGPKRGGKSSSSSSGVKKPSSKSTSTSTKTPKRPKPERGTATTSQAGSSPTAVTRSSSPAGGSASGSEDESGSDQGIYCLCRGPDNHRFMIACDRCEDWFHGDCIGMDKYTGENLVQRYICPRCTDGKLYVTRYKKTCALERCDRPARMYGDDVVKGESSIFCSAEHRQVWWERLVGTLPKRREGGVLYGDTLTQEEFMGLLGTGKKEGKDGKGWRIGEEPFGVPDNFWETTPPSKVLTEEESSLLSTSVSDRHSLGEEIVLCKKMLQLVDMAVKQREHLISSSLDKPNKSQHLGKDFCGYDYRLDSVGATACFADFLKSPAGEAIFKTGRLPLPGEEGFVVFDDGYVLDAAAPAPGQQQQNGGGVVVNGNNNAAALAGVVCVRRKCKTHAGWSGIHTKNVKHQIKELAAQAKEKLDFEARIRDCAAVRYLRKKRERNSVEVVDAEMEG